LRGCRRRPSQAQGHTSGTPKNGRSGAARRLARTVTRTYATRPPTRSAPSQRVRDPPAAIPQTTKDNVAITGTSTRTSWRSTVSGAITAASPRITNTLKILLPTTLPTTIPGSARAAAMIPVTSSGALVPKETTVRPITNGLIPSARAADAAPRTSNSAPATSKARPASNNNTSAALIGTGGEAGAPRSRVQ